METSVIFGPESPLPRVVTVNVTIDLFDGQLSLLDFEIRSTEQSQIWKSLLKPTVAPVPALLDALEKAVGFPSFVVTPFVAECFILFNSVND